MTLTPTPTSTLSQTPNPKPDLDPNPLTKQAAAALGKQPAKTVSDKIQADAVAALSAQRELLPPPFQKVADAATLYVPRL